MKYDKYKEIAKAVGMSFYLLVHEAYGRVGIQPHNLLKAVASVIYYWRARVSISLQISQKRAGTGLGGSRREEDLALKLRMLIPTMVQENRDEVPNLGRRFQLFQEEEWRHLLAGTG